MEASSGSEGYLYGETNIRYVTSEQIPEKIDFASVDVSFISLKKVLGPAMGTASG